MHAKDKSMRLVTLGFTTAMAAALLTGCAANPAPRAEVSASAAVRDMARGQHERAVQHAETAVQADPNNPAYRMVLGNAYLDAGRFASAEAAFSDAMTLGDASPRSALSLALARIAQAKYASAIDALGDHEGEIARADLGLALALAGQPERGIHLMSNAIRGGENTIKMRQNLAYAYAMAGRWREARLMVQQDVPAGEVGTRLEQWARLAPSGAYQHRVAGLLGVPVGAADSGQPANLALSHNPTVEQLAAESFSAPALPPSPTFASAGELPALGDPAPQATHGFEPTSAPAGFVSASSAPAATNPSLDARRVVREPVVQALPARHAAAVTTQRPARQRFADTAIGNPAPAPTRTSTRTTALAADATHLVQLGSFLSERGAERAWEIYVSRYPELAGREMVITEAVVRGRHYWRVSAGGFDQLASRAMCNRIRSNGNAGCISWAASRPLPGAIDSGLRLARR